MYACNPPLLRKCTVDLRVRRAPLNVTVKCANAAIVELGRLLLPHNKVVVPRVPVRIAEPRKPPRGRRRKPDDVKVFGDGRHEWAKIRFWRMNTQLQPRQIVCHT